jgi:glycosyltransferase involved in cell wall biosynthesis
MPEEINRLLVDAVSDLLWTPSEDADANLLREGIHPERIVRVGNIMIDAYCMLEERIAEALTVTRLGLQPLSYAVVTMHRPVNVDHFESLSLIVGQLVKLAARVPVVFPVHPRTRSRLESFDLIHELVDVGIQLIEPLGYIEFMKLVSNCRLVVTDSGGIQEETSYLGVPCLTTRESTERPITLSLGSNRLIAISQIDQEAKSVMKSSAVRLRTCIPLWDGQTAERITESLFRQRTGFSIMMQPLSRIDVTADTKRRLSPWLKRLVDLVSQVNRPCMLCFRIHMERRDLEWLLSQRHVQSIVLAYEIPELRAEFPERVGNYLQDGTAWQLPLKIAKDMVLVGREADFGTRAAWQAWRAGVRSIRIVSRFQPNEVQGLIQVVIRKAFKSLFYRLWKKSLSRKRVGCMPGLEVQESIFTRKLRAVKERPLPFACAPTDWALGRIIVVGGTLGPGGAERQLTATLLGLVSRGHKDVHFLHHSPMHKPNDFFLPQLIEAGIQFFQVTQIGDSQTIPQEMNAELMRCLSPLGDLGAEVAAYAEEFLVRRPEIVHVWLDYTNVVAGLAPQLVCVARIVLSCRSLSPVHFAFIQPHMRPIYRLLARFQRVTFLNNSKVGALDYERWIGDGKLKFQVVHNGFDFSLFPKNQDLLHLRSEYRRGLGIPADVPVVGVIMRISEEKRPLLWIEIAGQVAKRIPEAHFLIVGNGPMREQVEAVGRATLSGKIHFPGHERNMARAMAAMDIFLLTSRMEGLPNVLIEAQALGVPPVAIDVGGVKETMIDGKTGWVCKDSESPTIADKIVKALSDPAAYQGVSAQAREFVRSTFNLDRMISSTLHVYGCTKIQNRSQGGAI